MASCSDSAKSEPRGRKCKCPILNWNKEFFFFFWQPKQGVFWPEKVEEFEKQTHPENINCETVTDDNKKETEQHNEVV